MPSIDSRRAKPPPSGMFGGDGGGLDAGDAGEPLVETFVKNPAMLGRRVFPVGQRQPHRQQMRRVDADVQLVQVEEAPHHQPGAGQQDECRRELDDDQRARPAARAHAAAAGPPALLQHLVEIRLRHVQRRGEAEDDAGAEADRREEGEHLRVHRERDPVRLADALGRGVEQPNTNLGQAEAEQPAEERQQHALDKQLADDAPA